MSEDAIREHPSEPAEGADAGEEATQHPDQRQHSQQPAEGDDG
ncbi:hypothetical protein [Cellulomonas sp.]|nr:hypothetical protein [Cellulomonas sp.]